MRHRAGRQMLAPRQHAGLELVLARGALDGVDAVGAQAGAGGDDLGEAGAAEQQADAVVDPVAGRQRARRHRGQVRGPAVGLAVVVDRGGAGQEAEAVDRPRPRSPLGDAGLEPAHRAGAEPGQHDPGLPRLAQDRVDPVRAPQRQQVDHRAAADVDHVLREQVLAQRHRLELEPEQRHHAGLAEAVAERDLEAPDLLLGVAARGRQQADARLARRRQREHVIVQHRRLSLHAEPSAPHGEDRRLRRQATPAPPGTRLPAATRPPRRPPPPRGRRPRAAAS